MRGRHARIKVPQVGVGVSELRMSENVAVFVMEHKDALAVDEGVWFCRRRPDVEARHRDDIKEPGMLIVYRSVAQTIERITRSREEVNAVVRLRRPTREFGARYNGARDHGRNRLRAVVRAHRRGHGGEVALRIERRGKQVRERRCKAFHIRGLSRGL